MQGQNLLSNITGLLVFALLVTMTSCASKPDYDDAQKAMEKYLGHEGSTICLYDSGVREMCHDPISRVQNIEILEIGSSRKITLLSEGYNQFGVPFPKTDDVTLWTITARIKLKCNCGYNNSSKTLIKTDKYEITNYGSGDYSVR